MELSNLNTKFSFSVPFLNLVVFYTYRILTTPNFLYFWIDQYLFKLQESKKKLWICANMHKTKI